MAAVVSDVVADVTVAVAKLRADDRLITSPEMHVCDLEAIFDAVTTLEAVGVRRLRDAAGSEAIQQWCGRSPKRWLVDEQLLAGPRASKLMRLLHQLPGHALTQAAYDAAEISTDHAAAIVTALQSLPAEIRKTVEPHLVERAKECPPEEIARFIDELLARLGLDKDAAAARERRHAERGVDVAQTLGGTRSVSGTLTPEAGEVLEKALDLAAQPSGPEDDRTPRQRRHDALVTIANAYLANNGSVSFAGAPRTVMITMDLETLENRLLEVSILLPSGARISAATARRLACDAELIPVVLGGNGEVLDIGQADHEFTTAIRRAAWIRDGGRCAFPQCSGKVVELHHIVFRRHKGATSLDNAAWLCGFHHWLVHEDGWTLQRQPHDGSYLWTSPTGRQCVRHLSADRHP